MGKLAVSVLIDTYNSGEFIEQAIESVLAQNFPPEQMEVLVVDDGSTDDTAERVRKYSDRIQYLHKSNGGQASAFNYGLKRARGEIVAFLDGDDYWLPGKLRRIVDEFRKSPEAGMVYDNFVKYDSPSGQFREGGIPGSSGFIPATANGLLHFEMGHPTSTLAFRSSALQRLLPVPERLVVQADGHLFACVLFVAPVVYIAEPLTIFRVHTGNLWNWAGNTPPGVRTPGQDPVAKARLQRRATATRAIGDGVREWLEKNGFDPNRPELRPFLMQWSLASRADEFMLAPPGRFTFFRYLFTNLRYYRARMSWRHQVVYGVNALGSLIVGYNNVHFLEEWRLGIKRFLLRPFQRRAIPGRANATGTRD